MSAEQINACENSHVRFPESKSVEMQRSTELLMLRKCERERWWEGARAKPGV